MPDEEKKQFTQTATPEALEAEKARVANLPAPVPQATAPTIPITNDDLRPQPTADFQTSPATKPESIQGITPEIKAPQLPETSSEKRAQDLSKRLEEINLSLVGRGAFRRTKEEEFGVQTEQKALEDLTARAKDLERREKAIPLTLQQQFEGRGATKAGVAPIEAARLRENAIEALTVSSLVDAVQLRLTSAERKVAKAVDEKYGPLLEEQAAKIANLDLIIKSPDYSREDKNRALKQKLIEEQNKAKIEAAKVEQKEIWDLGTKAAPQLAKIPNGTQILEQARTAKTKEDVLKILAPYLEKKDLTATTGSLEEFKLIYGREPKDITELNAFTQSRAIAGRAPTSEEKPTSLTAEDRRTLLGSGFSDKDIISIQNDARQYGIDKVLEQFDKTGATPQQKAALRKVYGAAATEITRANVLEVARKMDTKDVENFLRARFTDDELKKLAKDAGFAGIFTFKKTEIANYLNSPSAREKITDILAEQYKTSGITVK